jgi:hypothetical protein
LWRRSPPPDSWGVAMTPRAANERRTFGRAGTGAGWTAGQRDSTRSNAKGKVESPRLDDPTVSDVRDMLASQWCWWCGRGPWRSLSGHTFHAHGITAARIRELGFLLKGVSTVSVELREALALRPQTINSVGLRAANASPLRSRAGRVLSEAGRIANAAKLAPYQTPEQRAVALRRSNEVTRRPHKCPVCGIELPRATPITCSPECRREVRRRTMQAVRTRCRTSL